MLGRNSQPFRVQHDAHRRHHRLEIQQRLALAHQYDIRLLAVSLEWRRRPYLRSGRRNLSGLCREPYLFLFAPRVSARFLERQQHLRQNFSRCQVANQSELRREAEVAIHRTARLRGNTDRLPPFARHEHSFHRSGLLQAACSFSSALLCVLCVKFLFFLGCGQTEQIPHRSIRRRKPLLHFRQGNARFPRQPLPQCRRKIRNLRHIKFSFCIQRVINLLRAECRLTERHAEFAQLFFRFA